MDKEKNGELIYECDDIIIQWFEKFLNSSSPSFAISVNYFKEYYLKCVDSLINLEYKKESRKDKEYLDGIYQEDVSEFKDSYKNVLKSLKNNPSLLEEALKRNLIDEELISILEMLSVDRINNMSREEACLLMTDKNYKDYLKNGVAGEVLSEKNINNSDINESMISFIKLQRYNNLYSKYIHTARVVYLTYVEVEKLGIEEELVRSILYTSSLFHDIGRFYQCAFNNTFADGEMKKVESNDKIGSLGHSEAGYYFSLLDMINLNILGASSDNDVIIHAIAALIVKQHSTANEKMGNFDKNVANFEFGDNIQQQLLDFVLSCYNNAEGFDGGIHGKFNKELEPGHAELMRNSFCDTMLLIINPYLNDERDVEKAKEVIYELFSYENPNLVLDKESIDILLKVLDEEECKKIETKIAEGKDVLLTPSYNEELRKYKLFNFIQQKSIANEGVVKLFEQLIEKSKDEHYYVQYDIVDVIKKVFEANGKGEVYKGIELPDDVAKIIRMSIDLVTDIDKFDILVQVVNRTVPWNPININVYALNGEKSELGRDETLIDVLENRFKINVGKTDEGKIILDDTLIDIIKANANINNDFKKNFGDNFDFSKLSDGQVVGEELFKINYIEDRHEPLFGKTHVIVPFSVMEKAHPNLEERFNIEKSLIMPDDLYDNFFARTDERKVIDGSVFPRSSKASKEEYFCYAKNDTLQLWWRIDQFITTNMRSMESLRFIKDSKMLSKISQNYRREECPKELFLLVNEALEFGNEFIDLALSAKINKDGHIIYDNQEKEGYAPIILTDKNVMGQIRTEAAFRHKQKMDKIGSNAMNSDVFDNSTESKGM